MKISLDEVYKQATPGASVITTGRFIETSDDMGGFDVLADCRTEEQARLFTHCFNHLLKLRNLLAEQTMMPDLVRNPELSCLWDCHWCGRSYGLMKDVPRGGLCPSDDCPGHVIRKALNEVNQVEIP